MKKTSKNFIGAGGIFKRFLCLLTCTALFGCGTLGMRDDPAQKKSLADVVDAIQYAVEKASQSKVWAATEIEAQHWNSACKADAEAASRACVSMVQKASPICKRLCTGGNCDPASQWQCTKLVKGEDLPGLCPESPIATGDQAAWCSSALSCSIATKKKAATCANAETIAMPELIKADLTLSVENIQSASAGINLLVVSFGASHSKVASNVVAMTMVPRARDTKYASDVLPTVPPVKTVSAEARALAEQLSSLITDAVAASVKEYQETPGKNGATARAPVLLSDLQVSFSLVLDSSGKLGIKKAWEIPLAGIELGGGGGTKRSNSLTITYSRPK